MGNLVEIKLGEYRGVGVYDANGVACVRDDIVVMEVQKGFECGIVLEGQSDVREGDVFQAYEVTYLEQDL